MDLSHSQYKTNFKGNGNISNVATARYVRKNIVKAIMGDEENSTLKLFSAELERNNYDISILRRRGTDRGVSIRYARNINGISFDEDNSTIGTRIMPKGYDGILLPEKYVDSPIINKYPHPIIREIEYSDIKLKDDNSEDNEGFETLVQCYEEMRKRVQKEFENGLDKPTISVDVDFVELSKTVEYKEYKNLEKVYLGDTIKIYLEKLGVDVMERVISTTYDVLADRFTNIELGKLNSNYVSENAQFQNTMEQVTIPNILEAAKNHSTQQLINAMGGYVYKTQSELFIMDTDNINTAQKVWRWNLNGLGYSSTGINGVYELAMTQDGNIVADFIKTGTMSVSRIEGLSNLLDGYSVQIGLNQENIDMLVSKQSNLENGINKLETQVKINADNVAAEFKQIGGSNLFLNSIGDFGSDNWEGNVKTSNNTDILRHSNSPSGNCFNLQNGIAKQIVFVKNGTFTISFTYKKLINLAECKVRINGTEYMLSESNYTDFEVTLDIVDNNITFEMISDTNYSCYIIDLLLNNGNQKQPWSPNSNEIISGAVKANSSGLEITSNTKNTRLFAGADGVRIENVVNGETVAEFTDTGTETEDLLVKGKAQIAGLLIQKVGNQIWLSSLL
ncbi:MAG: phage tail spike protein [Clostridia bacterium]